MDFRKDEIDLIQRYIRRNSQAVTRDKAAMEEMKAGKISPSECKKKIFRNNSFPSSESKKISDESFVRWAESLGYGL